MDKVEFVEIRMAGVLMGWSANRHGRSCIGSTRLKALEQLVMHERGHNFSPEHVSKCSYCAREIELASN